MDMLSDSSPRVKESLMGSVRRLCTFFGRHHTLEYLMPLLITFLNDKESSLRKTFFHQVMGISIFVGRISMQSFLLPCITQAIYDSDESVVHNALHALASLCEIGLLSKKTMLNDIAPKVAPLLVHPGQWVRMPAVRVLSSIARSLGMTGTHCFLMPVLESYLSQELVVIEETTLLQSLKKHTSRKRYLQALHKLLSGSPSATSPEERKRPAKDDRSRISRMRHTLVPSFQQDSGILGSFFTSDKEKTQSAGDKHASVSAKQLTPPGSPRRRVFSPDTSYADDETTSLLQNYISLASQAMQTRLGPSVEIPQRASIRASPSYLLSPESYFLQDDDAEASDYMRLSDKVPPVLIRASKDGRTSHSIVAGNAQGYLAGGINPGFGSSAGVPWGSGSVADLTSAAGMAHASRSAANSTEFASNVSSLGSPSDSDRIRSWSANASPRPGGGGRGSDGEPDELHLGGTPRGKLTRTNTTSLAGSGSGSTPHPSAQADPRHAQVDPRHAARRRAGVVTSQLLGGSFSEWKPVGHLLANLHEHKSAVNRISVSHDHTYFATASNDGTVKLWDGQMIESDALLTSRLTYTPSSALQRDSASIGQKLTAQSSANLPRVTSVAVCNTTRRVACSTDAGEVSIFDIEYSSKVSAMMSDNAVAGGRVYTGCSEAHHLDYATEGSILTLEYLEDPYSSLLFCSTQRGGVHAFDPRLGKDVWTLHHDPRQGLAAALAIDPAGQWLVVGTRRGYFSVWDVRFQLPVKTWRHPSGAAVHTLIPHSVTVRHPRRPSAAVLAAVGPNEVNVFDIERGECGSIFKAYTPTARPPPPATHAGMADAPPPSDPVQPSMDEKTIGAMRTLQAEEFEGETVLTPPVADFSQEELSSKVMKKRMISRSASSPSVMQRHLIKRERIHLDYGTHELRGVNFDAPAGSPNTPTPAPGASSGSRNSGGGASGGTVSAASDVRFSSVSTGRGTGASQGGASAGSTNAVAWGGDTEHSIRSLLCPHDGSFLLTAGTDRRVRYWDLGMRHGKNDLGYTVCGQQADEPKSRITMQEYPIQSTEEAGQTHMGVMYLECPGENTQTTIDSRTKQRPPPPSSEHTDAVLDIRATLHPRKMLISAGRDGVVKLWR
eukprot:Rmarinus@m.22575